MYKESADIPTKAETFRTVKETEEILRCCRTFLWSLRRSGQIQCIKAGRKVLIPQSSIDVYIALNKEEVRNV